MRLWGARSNASLSRVDRNQEFLGLFPCREAAQFAIIGIVLGRVRRTKRDEFIRILSNNAGEVLAIERRHIARATMRALVIARAGPLIGPYPPASVASIEVQKPGDAGAPMIADDSFRVR